MVSGLVVEHQIRHIPDFADALASIVRFNLLRLTVNLLSLGAIVTQHG